MKKILLNRFYSSAMISSGLNCPSLRMDDTAKGGTDTILGTFYHDSLRSERFQTLISLLFENTFLKSRRYFSICLTLLVISSG